MAEVTLKIIAENETTGEIQQGVREFGKLSQASKNALGTQKKGFEDSARASANANKGIIDLTRNVNIAGVNVGQLGSSFGSATKSVGSFIQAMGLVKAAVAATGIGLLLIAIASLISFFKKTEEGAEKLERIMSGLGAAFDVVAGFAAKLGKVLAEGGTISVRNFGDQLSELTKKAIEAANAQAELTRRTQELEDQQRGTSVVLALAEKQIDKLLQQAKNRSLSEKERLSLLNQASKSEETSLQIQTDAAQERLDIIRQENKLKREAGVLRDVDDEKEKNAIREIIKLERESIVLQEKITNRKAQLEQEITQDKQKEIEKRKKLEEDLQADLLKLFEASEKARIEKLSGTQRIEEEFRVNQASVDAIEKQIIEKGKLFDKDFKLTQQQEEQLTNLRLANEAKRSRELISLIRENRKKQIDAEKALEEEAISDASGFVDANLKALQDQNKARILLTKEGSKERLAAEIEAIETERDFILNNTQITADQQIIIVEEAAEKIANLKNSGFSLSALLGISEEDFKKVQDSLKTVSDAVQDALEAQFEQEKRILDKRKSINDELVSENEKRVDDLESQLERELELSEKGFASNVDLVRSQLDEATKAKQAALEEDKRIKEEQEKLARKQLLIEAAQQASALISAGATLFAKGAFTGPVGIAISAATIAAMIASFIAIKAKIKEATAPGFYKGGYTGEGNEREEAGVVHKREFVSTAQTTKKHRHLLEALHSEDFSKLKPLDIKPILEGTGVVLPDVEKINNSIQSPTIINNIKSEESKRLLLKVYKELVKMNESDSKKPVKTVLPDGTIVEKTGNTTRKIRRKNG